MLGRGGQGRAGTQRRPTEPPAARMHCLAPTARGRRRPSPPSRDLLWVGRASHFPRGVGWRIREARLRSVTHFPVTSRCWADPGLLLPLRATGLTSILRQRVSAGSVQTPGSGQMCPGPSPATGCIGGGGGCWGSRKPGVASTGLAELALGVAGPCGHLRAGAGARGTPASRAQLLRMCCCTHTWARSLERLQGSLVLGLAGLGFWARHL